MSVTFLGGSILLPSNAETKREKPEKEKEQEEDEEQEEN